MSEHSSPPVADQAAPDPGARQRGWLPDAHFSRYLAAAILCINLLVAAGAWYFLDESWRSEELLVRARALMVVRLIAKDIESQYERIDVSLRAVSEEYAEQLASGRQPFEAWMRRFAGRHQTVNFMRITDANGDVIYAPEEEGRIRANIADRDYFIRLRADPQAGLQVSPPLLGRTTGMPLIVLARRLKQVDQGFSGVVVAAIPIDRLEKMLAAGLPGAKEGYVGLVDAQFGWVVAQPAMVAKTSPFAALRDAASQAPESGVFLAGGGTAGERLVAYARSELFGFYVVVGQPAVALFAGWRKTAWLGGVGVALFGLLTAACGWLLSRSRRQQVVNNASLLERDQWIRQAQEVGGLGLYSFDIDSARFLVTEAVYAIAGIDEAYPHTWEGWLAIIHADDRAAMDSRFREAVAGWQDVPEIEYRIVRPSDGGVRWLRSVAHAVIVPGSARRALSGVIADISAHKHDEDALRQSEQLFRSVFENSMIGMATTSPQKGWLTVNRTLCDILGYEHDELQRMTWAEFTHPDDLAVDVAYFNRVLTGEIDGYDLDKRFIRKSGEIVDVYIAARAIRRSDHSIDHFVALVQNITPRKRIEEQLRASEAALSAAVDQAAAGIAFVAPDGRWLRVNERLCELVGYSQTELLTLSFQDITHPDDLALDLEQLARLLRREIDSYTLEKRYLRKDGRCIWINLSVSLINNDDGSPRHFVSVIEDIDARKIAEQDSRSVRAMLKSFLDHLPGLAAIKDRERRVLFANRGFQAVLNLDDEQIVGRSNSELFPGELGATIDSLDQRVLASGETEVVELAYAERIYQTTSFIIRQDDGHELLGGIALDVTRRYRLEQRTQALLAINEHAGTLPEKEFLAYGLEVAEKLTASRVGFLHSIHEDQDLVELSTWSAGAKRVCTAAFDTHYPISKAGIWADCCREKRALCFNDYAGYAAKCGLPDGHAPLQRLISVPVIEHGAVRMIVGVGNRIAAYDDFDVETVQMVGNEVWSVVQRARAEAALARRLAEVTELNGKLEDAHLQLLQSEKMSAIGQLAAGVAHELNNPIGFVYSNLGTLGEYAEDLLAIDAAYSGIATRLPALAAGSALDEVRRLKAASDHAYLVEDLPKLIRESKEGLERVRKIVLDLRDFSRVGESEWQWADLEQGLESTINIVWNELKYKADVERHYTPLPMIRCLASQLNQVFMNLLVNAAQAIEAHGTIVIRTGTDADDAGSLASVWVEIEDSGRGMSPEVQKRLFEPFYTTKAVGKGTGLGLSIAFGIIVKHDGRIDFRSELGRGTTFRITLPIDASQAGVRTVA